MKRWIVVVLVVCASGAHCVEPKVAPYEVSGDLREVVNLKDFAVTKEMRATLLRNLFCVVAADDPQPWYVYEENDYRSVPSFVTADSVLHLYHLVFGFTLRTLEQEKLYPVACRLTDTMVRRSLDTYGKLTDPKLRKAQLRNLAFFGVAARLLGQPASLPKEARVLVEQELPHIAKHAKFELGAILPYKVDYTQYVPRGHYTRNETLKRYFMGMMWYGLMPLSPRLIDKGPDEKPVRKRCDQVSRQALLMVHDLYAAQVQELWRTLYEPACFFVGFSDDLRPDEVKKLIGQVYGKDASLDSYADADRFESFVQAFIGARQPRIKPTFIDIAGTLLPHVDPGTPQLRFMGQRDVPDSEITQRVVGGRDLTDMRLVPKGLDVMAVLGSPRAVRLLDVFYKEPQKWSGYLPARDKLVAEFTGIPEKQWTSNLYWGWLNVLRSMVLPYGEGYPSFMRNNGWQDKSLSSALASWAQLRHDTILYVKQSFSGAECGGGGDEPPPPHVVGYVEPVPETYGRLLELLKLTKDMLVPRELMTEGMASRVEEFEDLVEFLHSCAIKELEGKPLTDEEYDTIRYIGGTLDELALWVIGGGEASEWYQIDSADRNMACVADVHTGQEVCLEEGVGTADHLYVIVPIEGKLYLTRGAVFSYYEFTHPKEDRLTDEKWQKMLKEQTNPEPPEWTKFFKVMTPPKEKPVVVAKPRSWGC